MAFNVITLIHLSDWVIPLDLSSVMVARRGPAAGGPMAIDSNVQPHDTQLRATIGIDRQSSKQMLDTDGRQATGGHRLFIMDGADLLPAGRATTLLPRLALN